MKFEEFKKRFFNNQVKKKDLVYNIKNFFSDYAALSKFVKRFERELIPAKSFLKNAILGDFYLPKSYAELGNSKFPFYTKSLEKEMNWQVLAFLECHQLINLFLKYREEFEHNLLLADYIKAREILNKIEQEICVSYWSMENKFILDEYQFGFERNWETRNSILDPANNAYVQALGNFFSLKTEKRVSFYQFNEEFNTWQETEDFNINDEHNGVLEYFRFKGNFFSYPKYIHLHEVLYIENKSSIIDKYILFIRIAQQVITEQKTEYNFILPLLKELDERIEDIAIKQIIISVSTIMPVNNFYQNNMIMNIIDEYTKGNYVKSKDLSKLYILNNGSNCIELFEIYAKSLIEANLEYEFIITADSFANEISKGYYEVLAKVSNTDNALVELVKLSYVFNNSHIGLHLYYFITEQLGWPSETNYRFLANLNSKFINPKLLTSLYPQQDIAKAFLKNITQTYKNSSTVELYNRFNENYSLEQPQQDFENISNTKNNLYQIRTLIIKEKYNECIVICNLILKESPISPITEYELLNILFLSFLKTANYVDCLILNVNSYLKNPHLVKKMDVASVLDSIITAKFKSIHNKADLIELPIFFKINYGDRIKIKQAYELYLNANNFVKPHELLSKSESIPKDKLIYFLKYVCIPEIMQLSKSFESTYLVNEERISICKFLSEIDISESNLYKTEIAELTQKNIISKVIGGIDERKIFVNELKILQIIKKAEKHNILQNEQVAPLTHESFDRYVKLLNYVKNNNEYRDISSIIHFGENGEVTFLKVEKNKTYSGNEVDGVLYLPAFKFFVSYFIYIRDLFIFSKEYGLDAYLSTRIRHGTLPNHLRSVFETYNLVTSQTDSVYARNQYWNEKYDFETEDKDKLQILLANFSTEIDTFSKDIKDSYIQCKNEKRNYNTEALFNYSYAEEELILLFLEEFESIDNIDEFIEKSFGELWIRTETNLEIIREKFNHEYRDKYVNLLDSLYTQILNLVDRQSVVELLNNIMTCKTEIQTKLNNISKWFRRSESSFEGEYELQILAEASIQINKNLHPSFHFEIEKSICLDFNIGGEYHQHFIDIMNNCLFNITKHSHVSIEELNAKLTIKEAEGNLILIFENCIADANEHVEKLTSIKNNWRNSDGNISQEGGTGYPKIKKIINSDLNRKSSDFNFSLDKNKLSIILSFETNGLKV